MKLHTRKHQQQIAATLVAVMMFALLHPAAVAMTVIQRGHDALLVEVCTAHGVSWVRLAPVDGTAHGLSGPDASGEPGTKALPSQNFTHCPMCFLGDGLPVDFDRADLSFPLPGFVDSLSQGTPWVTAEADLILLMAPPRAPPSSATKT